MPHQRHFTLVVRNSGRSSSDTAWEIVEPQFVLAWKFASKLLQKRHLSIQKEKYTVSIDWDVLLQRQKRHYAAMRYIHDREGRPLATRIMKAKFPRRPAKIPAIVLTGNEKAPHALSVAESVINDSFLIMNIAAPGSFDLYRASLLGERIEPDISLSNFCFEDALHVALEEEWPSVQFIDLNSVLLWFDSVRVSPSQIPQNPMERVLFALLHMSKISLSPMLVVWLFYAFESLLQTRVGENFSSIVRRLSLLLEPNPEQLKTLKKRMRDLYDIRSAIVHGGFEVTHPMHDESIDKRVEESFIRMLRASEHGCAYLLAAIQKTILMGWKFPLFDETVNGISFKSH